jgi:hypothetical protein
MIPDQLFVAALHSFEQFCQQQPSQLQQSSEHHTYQDSNQISGQSLQAQNRKSNTMDDTFAAITTVQQIMTELSCAATEQEKVTVITKVVPRLLKNNATKSS